MAREERAAGDAGERPAAREEGHEHLDRSVNVSQGAAGLAPLLDLLPAVARPLGVEVERCATCGRFVGATFAGCSTLRRHAPERALVCERCHRGEDDERAERARGRR